VDSLQDDIQHLNEQLLLIASDPELGERTLKMLLASAPIIQRIVAASSNAVSTAIRCRIPLVTFTAALEDLAVLNPRAWRANSAVEIPVALQELTHFALEFAHDLVRAHPTVARMYFGLSRLAADGLGGLALKHLLTLSRRHGVLLRLRAADQPQLWDRLLIGERCSGPRAYRISQQMALLSLGAE